MLITPLPKETICPLFTAQQIIFSHHKGIPLFKYASYKDGKKNKLLETQFSCFDYYLQAA